VRDENRRAGVARPGHEAAAPPRSVHSATERAIQVDEAGEPLLARRDERKLRVIEAGLRRQHLQVAVTRRCGSGTAKAREHAAASRCSACCAASCSSKVPRAARPSATSRNATWMAFSYCATPMSFADDREVEVRRSAPPSKIGARICRRERPGERARAKEAAQCRALGANAGGQADVGEKRGALPRRCSRFSERKQRLGLQDVRAARQQIGRQSRGNVGEELLLAERHGRRQVRRQRLANEQDERVLGLRACARLCGKIGVRLLDHGLRLLQAQLGRGAGVELQLHDLV